MKKQGELESARLHIGIQHVSCAAYVVIGGTQMESEKKLHFVSPFG
jgi:hypothetical protein